MSEFFRSLRDAIAGLKNLGQLLEEVRAVRALLAQHLDLIGNYTDSLAQIRRQLEGIVSKLPFK